MDEETIIEHIEEDRHSITLDMLPVDRRTQEVCDVAVPAFPQNSRYVPEPLLTPENLQSWVEQDGWVLGYIPQDKKTVALGIVAVMFDHYILEEEWVWGEDAAGVAMHDAVAAHFAAHPLH